METKINLPILISFDDYHDITYLGRDLKRIIPSIKWKELDYEKYGTYVGLFYVGENPSKKEIEKMKVI